MIIITDLNKCNGCHACANACPRECITMVYNSEGFLYPKIDMQLCIECGKCVRKCPVNMKDKISYDFEVVAYAATNKDETIRKESSSGGIFTLIGEFIISLDGVVFGACFNDKFEVFHDYVETSDELYKLRGSKYVQSRIGNCYFKVKEFLELGRWVLFTGTPCQIGGLKSYLGKDYDKLICQDIICHGVPSPKVWEKYIKYRENQVGSYTKRIAFRAKNEGWKRYSVLFTFINNTEYRKTFRQDIMMKAFLTNVCLRQSCYGCSFKSIKRQSDITLADFWGIQNVLPEMDDDKGTSLVIAQSEKGQEILNQLQTHMNAQKVDMEKAIKGNSAMVKSAPYNIKREEFFKELDEKPFDALVKIYCELPIVIRIAKYFRRILSKIKRTVIRT